jgi:hypothetical protein
MESSMDALDGTADFKVAPHQVVEMIGSMLESRARPGDDAPTPPGPWDPLIRGIFAHASVFGPQPEPWRLAAVCGVLHRGDFAALNPQPLPPRALAVATLGRALLARAELIGEAAAHSGNSGAAARYVTDLIDDWCGTPPRKLPWPWPGPRPQWAEAELGALDHLILASVLEAGLGTGIGGEFAEGVSAGQQHLVETAMETLRG